MACEKWTFNKNFVNRLLIWERKVLKKRSEISVDSKEQRDDGALW